MPDGNVTVNYELRWLTADAYHEVRALYRRIKSIMDDAKRRRAGRLYLTLSIATPVTRKARRSRRSDDRSISTKSRGSTPKPRSPRSGR